MRTGFSRNTTPSTSPSRFAFPPRSPCHTFSESMMDENLEIAESVITKWDSTVSSYASITSLFRDNRENARRYLKSVKGLQTAMRYFASENASSEKLVRAQKLMQTAMHRLEKEFYDILSANREYLDPESISSHSSRQSTKSGSVDSEEESEDDFRFANETTASEQQRAYSKAMADLKAIADCMISTGYGKECVKIYNIVRKSIIDEALYHLGVEALSLSQVQKMDWEVLEFKIKRWLIAVRTAVKTLLDGERILLDHVFSSSEAIRESSFATISKESAMTLFGFPELLTKCKRTPEKLFLYLDMYEVICDLWPEINSIFSFQSTSEVLSQAATSLMKLGEAVRLMLIDFESAIQKDSSKTVFPGGGVHPLTRYVMNYLSFLTDYSEILAEILAGWPLTLQCPLPQSYPGSPEHVNDPVTSRLSWLILLLLCKLDSKASLYSDVALSYIFLANNLQYVVEKVTSSNLKSLLADDWIASHQAKVRQYISNYERVGWSAVFSSLPEDTTTELSQEELTECFRKFNRAFKEAHRKQSSWVVHDPKLRDEIKGSLAKKLGARYGKLYERIGLRRAATSEPVVRFGLDDIENYLSDLFHGSGSSVTSS